MDPIVIIEENNFLRMRIGKVLKKNGLSIAEFANMQWMNATNLMSSLKNTSLFIIDLDNRGINSLEIIERIRKSDDLKDKPIVALSNSSEISFLSQAIAVGCSDFVLKPYEDEFLLAKILKSIAHKNAQPISYVHYEPNVNQVEGVSLNLNWSPDYEIGVHAIDEDHKAIVSKFKMLYELMKEGKGHVFYLELLDFLHDYVNGHFTREEAFQKQISYTHLQEHQALHQEFRDGVEKIIQQHQEGQITNEDLIKISLFIKDWLLHHILLEDRKINLFIEEQKRKAMG